MLYKSFPNSGLRMLRAQISFMAAGSDRYRNLGDHEGITITPTLTEVKDYSNNSPTKILRKSFLTQKEAEVKFALKDGSRFMRAVMMMGDPEELFTQTAAADKTKTWDDPVVGDILYTGDRQITGGVITGWTVGTNYVVHAASGGFEIIELPTGNAADTFPAKWSRAAVTASAGKLNTGFLASQGLRGALLIETVDEGAPFVVELHDVELRPDGDIVLSATDDKVTAGGLKGVAYPVDAHPVTGAVLPEGKRIGVIADL